MIASLSVLVLIGSAITVAIAVAMWPQLRRAVRSSSTAAQTTEAANAMPPGLQHLPDPPVLPAAAAQQIQQMIEELQSGSRDAVALMQESQRQSAHSMQVAKSAGERLMLRSRRADLAEQELYGLLLVHFALRRLMHEASRTTGCDPDHLSFIHTVRIVRRHLPFHAAFSPPAAAPDG